MSNDDSSTRFGRRQAAGITTLNTDNETKEDSSIRGGRRAGNNETNTNTNGPSSGWGDSNTNNTGGPMFTSSMNTRNNDTMVSSGNSTNNSSSSSSSSSSRHKFVQDTVTEVVAVIRDTDQETIDDLASKIASAPRNTTRRVQSLAELDNDTFSSFTGNNTTANNNNSLKNIDLSLLTSALCSPEILQENDEVWEFDRLLQSLSQQMTIDAEKKEGEEASSTTGKK